MLEWNPYLQLLKFDATNGNQSESPSCSFYKNLRWNMEITQLKRSVRTCVRCKARRDKTNEKECAPMGALRSLVINKTWNKNSTYRNTVQSPKQRLGFCSDFFLLFFQTAFSRHFKFLDSANFSNRKTLMCKKSVEQIDYVCVSGFSKKLKYLY